MGQLRTHLGANVKSLRRKARLSRETLAVKAGVSFSTVQRIEGDHYWPSAGTVNAIASALGTTVADLLAVPSESVG